MHQGGPTAFSTAHPAVPALYAAVTLVLVMSSFHPVLIGLSLVGAFAFLACADGLAAALAPLRWQLPALILIALVNPLFAQQGSTLLLGLPGMPVFLESLCYGACMAGLLLSGVLWFRVAERLVSYDKVTALLGGIAPVAALMVSMTMRLIPRLARRGTQIAEVQDVALGRANARRAVVGRRLRQTSVLMGWAMEDSLECADVMRARGWGSVRRRSTYARYRMTARDVGSLTTLALGGAMCAALAWGAASAFGFYPVISPVRLWWGYVPYAAWMLVPTVLLLRERSL